jgi:hypothetical protein
MSFFYAYIGEAYIHINTLSYTLKLAENELNMENVKQHNENELLYTYKRHTYTQTHNHTQLNWPKTSKT